MKKLLAITAAVAVVAMAGTAMAANSVQLNVTAQVINTCKFTGPGTLAFGNLDPTLANGAATATSSGISIQCDSGTSNVVVTPTSTNGWTLNYGTNTIAYTLAAMPAVNTDGLSHAYNVTGNIAPNAYSSKPAGTYLDTVTLNVTP
jgi:spore coat protein U-like protein